MAPRYGKGIRDAIPVAGLLLLCFFWSLESLRTEFAPGRAATRLPPFGRDAVQFALLALAATLLALVRRSAWPGGRQIWNAILVGLGLFVAPAILSRMSSTIIPDLSRVALFSLTPVFAVALEPYLGRLTEAESKTGLLAALGCVIGTLGVFPMAIPGTMEAAAGFLAVILAVASVAAANCRATRLVCELDSGSGATVAGLAGAVAALLLGGASLWVERDGWSAPALRSEITWSSQTQLPALLLLFWLMRRMSAVRMTTRFVLTPLLVNVAGLIVLRPSLNLRSVLGLVLIAISAGWLLCAREDENEAGALPLNLKRN